jgi:hypothetical protein
VEYNGGLDLLVLMFWNKKPAHLDFQKQCIFLFLWGNSSNNWCVLKLKNWPGIGSRECVRFIWTSMWFFRQHEKIIFLKDRGYVGTREKTPFFLYENKI